MIMFCARWYAPKLNKEVGCDDSISSAPSGASASVIIYCLLWLAHTEDQILISEWSGKLVEVSKWMDVECILFWMGQRCFIHITQEGCSRPLPSSRNFSRPTELHRRASSPTTRIITLSPFLCAVFFGVGGLRIQRLGMQKLRQVAVRFAGWRFPVFCKLTSFVMNLNIEHCQKRIDRCSRLISIREQVTVFDQDLHVVWGSNSWWIWTIFSREHWYRGAVFCWLDLQGTTHSHW